MKIVLQNCLEASVSIDGKLHSEIKKGYILLVSFTFGDDEQTCIKLAEKISKLRIFMDENGKTNLSLKDVEGDILSISQFTLYADLHKGNRPSFVNCLEPKRANELYEFFNDKLRELGYNVETGVFGADMKVSLINDGPFTLVIDSEDLKK